MPPAFPSGTQYAKMRDPATGAWVEDNSDRVSEGPLSSNRLFHTDFTVKHPGDLILCAVPSDAPPEFWHVPRLHTPAVYFHFPRRLLIANSPHFAKLTPADTDGLVDGSAIVYMPNVTPSSLSLFLRVLRSTTSESPYEIPRHCLERDILGAAVIGKQYSVPIIYRLLCESSPANDTVAEDVFRRFAIWAIGDAQRKMEVAAGITLQFDITAVNREVVNILREHAPVNWLKLLDLHIRQAHGPARFHEMVQELSSELSFESHHPYPASTGEAAQGAYEKCGKVDGTNAPARVVRRLMQAGTVEDIKAVADGGYGLKCTFCQAAARDEFSRRISWLSKFTTNFELPNKGYHFEL